MKAIDQVIALPSRDPDIPYRLSHQGTDPKQPTEALKKLRLLAATFQGGLESFLEILSLQTGLDSYEPDQENVKLLTFHAAKGLEFPFVILSGCEANLLPLTVFGESDPEEERRLFYVGLTRATQNIFLTWAKKRRLHGQTLWQSPSPFLGRYRGKAEIKRPPSGNLEAGPPSPSPTVVVLNGRLRGYH